MSKIFDYNLELFAKERPVDAMRLQYADFSHAPKMSFNDEDPEEWFQTINFETKVLYIYGIGLGSYYAPLKKWLKSDPEKLAIFIEDDYAVLHRFLGTKTATEILKDNQVMVVYLSGVKDENKVIDTLYWSTVLAPFAVTATKSYRERKSKVFEELGYKIVYDTTMKNALVEEYLKYGASFFRNFYPNILNLSGSFWGNALFGKFKGIPAIICGAGPSLEKQIDKLGNLKDHALIFAGGSSLNGILAKNVLPHFGAGIDPNPTQLERLDASQAAKVPFFYRSRMLVEASKKIRGQRLYISGVGGYDVADFYEKKLDLESEFLDEGHNVVNFCTEVAVRMGCNPIIYVGMDLAFTDMKAYSTGIDDAKRDKNREELFSAEDQEYRGIEKKDIYGEPTITLWKWIAESDWLSRFAKEHPSLTFINATEGGIGFSEIANMSLEKAVENLQKLGPFEDKIQKEIQLADIPQATALVLKNATLELKASLENCITQLDILLNEIEKEKQKPNTTGSLVSGESALAEADLFEEPAYIYILDIFHQVFARVQNRAVTQMRLNKENTLDNHSLALKKLSIQKEKLLFLHNTAEANIALIDLAIAGLN